MSYNNEHPEKGTSSNPTPRELPAVTPRVTPRVTPVGKAAQYQTEASEARNADERAEGE
jgi:hypothetical protein